MVDDLRPGSVVWVEHTVDGDIYYKVKIILERQPMHVEVCRVCHNGKLALMGHVIQTGYLDDKVYAICRCAECCAFAVFIYSVTAGTHIMPEPGGCYHEETDFQVG